MKIILSGGGTLGPVTPLLSIVESYRKTNPETKFVWVGTKEGPEKSIVETYNIPFYVIGAGKWRRYFSWKNFLDIFKITIAFFQSILLLWNEKPDLLISAGGFVSVPLHWAGSLLGIPTWVHQQDVRPGLANRLMVAGATKITTALQDSVKYFPKKKTEWIGNPTRDLVFDDLTEARKFFNIPESAPVIFALGGGTGSNTINNMIVEAIASWPKDWHVIHLTGKERPGTVPIKGGQIFPNYHVYEFLSKEISMAYAIATVVIARAGFGTLSELASLSKAAVIIPMHNTHQDDNAEYLSNKNGIIKLPSGTNGIKIAHIVSDLIKDPKKITALGSRLHEILPQASESKLVGIIEELVG
jgi:UDP-N-acetylglucosamine--N-acetylmuramyl-(pentapeptide) pyrophosphoryl-undecaprenol N-acetylglucosamine transferase